jgi:hypothetical protein
MITPHQLQLADALLSGAVLGAIFVGTAYAIRRHTDRILAGVMIVAALAYVLFAFALDADARPAWLAVELAGVALYGGMAVRGVRGSPWWLVAGWLLHPLWDVALHYAGPGAHFAPVWWTVPCLSWDLVTAGYVALRIVRGTHPAGARVAAAGAR